MFHINPLFFFQRIKHADGFIQSLVIDQALNMGTEQRDP